MRKFCVVFLAAACFAGLGTTACSKSKKAKEQPQLPAGGGGAINAQPAADLAAPLATVDGVVITVGELQERLNRMSPYIRARYTSLEQKKEFLGRLVNEPLFAAYCVTEPGALVKNVAVAAGFPDAYHFSRVFKRRYGVPPAQFGGKT